MGSSFVSTPTVPFELLEAFGIVGHRLFDADGVRCRMATDGDDSALREELMPDNYRIELLVRGRFRVAGRTADPGKIDTRWVLQSEMVSTFSGHAGYGIVSGLADRYVRIVIDCLTRAYGIPPETMAAPAAVPTEAARLT